VLGRTLRPALTVLAAVAMTAVTVMTAGTSVGLAAGGNPSAGPPYNYTTELMGEGKFIPLKDVAMLTRTDYGYRFRTGQQDSHLVVTQRNGKLRLVDTGTKSWKKLSPACTRQRVRVGISAVCRIPGSVTQRRPLLVEVWPRLGNDFTDGSSLPATVAMTVLGDEGHDVARLGAGPDFFNGHSGRDRVSGGGDNDWIRAGLGNDVVSGGSGRDWIVAMEGHDTVTGGDGDDRVYGSDGDDRLRGDAGEDMISCGSGRDRATADGTDRAVVDCEVVDGR
jgi:serralysin